MNVSKRTLHQIDSRRKLKSHTSYMLKKYEDQYYHQKKLSSAQNLSTKKSYSKLNRPYEVKYKVTRTIDESTGNASYKQGFVIVERNFQPYKPRGVLHKIDYIRKNKIESDVKGIAFVPHVILHSTPARTFRKAARFAGTHTSLGRGVSSAASSMRRSLRSVHVSSRIRNAGSTIGTITKTSARAAGSAAMKTGLFLESSALKLGDDVKYRAKAAITNKFREEMNDDASKSAMVTVGTSIGAAKAITSHFYEKHKSKPFRKAFNERLRNEKKITKRNRHIINAQNNAYIKSVIAEQKYFKKTGRHIKLSDDVKFVVDPRSKINKIKKKQDKVQKKLFRLQNRSLLHKGVIALSAKSLYSLKSHAIRASGDNDALKGVAAAAKTAAVSKNAAKSVLNLPKNRKEKLNYKLQKHSKRESKLHKKEARFNTVKNKKKPAQKKNKWAKDIYKKNAEKMAKRAVFRKKSSRFIAIAVGLLGPVMVMPFILVSCLGMLGNRGTFAYLTSYYNTDVVSLTQASNYYQKLAYDINYTMINAKDHWKDNLEKYGVPKDYKDEPTKFIYDNNGANFDFDKHKLYSFLTAFTFSEPEEENEYAKQWIFTDTLKVVLDNLFKATPHNREIEKRSHAKKRMAV